MTIILPFTAPSFSSRLPLPSPHALLFPIGIWQGCLPMVCLRHKQLVTRRQSDDPACASAAALNATIMLPETAGSGNVPPARLDEHLAARGLHKAASLVHCNLMHER